MSVFSWIVVKLFVGAESIVWKVKPFPCFLIELELLFS